MPSNVSNKRTPLWDRTLHEIHTAFKRSKNGKGFTTNSCNLILKREFKLAYYAYKNNTEGMKQLLNLGASPNCTDAVGRGALHLATSRGNSEAVKILLEHGADPNRRDVTNSAPLHLVACKNINFPIISLLLQAGADVNQLNARCRNPLHLAQSKLQLLHRIQREGSIEMTQVGSELESIVDTLKQVLQLTPPTGDVGNLMTFNSKSSENLDDQISNILLDLERTKI